MAHAAYASISFWMRARVTVLGSGTSHGVPMIGCDCAVCRRPIRATTDAAVDLRRRRERSDDPRRHLDRPARAGAAQRHPRVDAILFTHSHADHVLGLDEVAPLQPDAEERDPVLRRRARRRRRCGGRSPTSSIRRPTRAAACRRSTLHVIDGPFSLGGVAIVPVPLMHGTLPISASASATSPT